MQSQLATPGAITGPPKATSRRLLGLLIVALPASIGLLTAPQTRAQPTAGSSSARFDAASVKLSAGGEGGKVRSLAGGQTFLATNVPLKFLIVTAYSMRADQISGGPAWVNSEGYDIVAKTDRPVSRDEQMLMLQALLADRFKLRLRNEKKVQPVYALVFEKAGPKFAKNTTGNEPEFGPLGLGHYIGKDVSMSYLAWSLGRIRDIGRVVVDKTALTGGYDLEFQFTPQQQVPNPQDVAPADPGPPVFTAIREQLGLKLEAAKEPLDFFTIDHVERPSGN